MNPKIAPTPWTTSPIDVRIGGDGCVGQYVRDAQRLIVCEVFGPDASARAEQIVRSVNACVLIPDEPPAGEDAGEPLTCDLCGCTIANVEAAITAGWEPSYWRPDKDGALVELSHPVCLECARDRLSFEDGENVLKS